MFFKGRDNQPQYLLAVCNFLVDIFTGSLLFFQQYNVHTLYKIHAKQSAGKPPSVELNQGYAEIVKLQSLLPCHSQ